MILLLSQKHPACAQTMYCSLLNMSAVVLNAVWKFIWERVISVTALQLSSKRNNSLIGYLGFLEME